MRIFSRLRPRRWPWLAGGAGAVLAGVLGVALVVQSQPAACAAPPTGGAVHRGKATFYSTRGGGNCSYDGPPADGLFVALGPQQYADAAACGGYLEVTGPKGRVRVKIVDRCPGCSAGHIDLSAAAFRKIADPAQGVVPVTFRAVVDPPLPGPLTFRIKEGASRYWFAVRVDNTGNPVASVRARGAGGAFARLTRTDYNYWLFDSGLGPGPFTIQVTDVYGNTATVDGIALRPGVTQTSTVRLYGPGGGAASRPGTPDASPTTAARTSPPAVSPSVPAPSSAVGVSPLAVAASAAPSGASAVGGGDCTG